MRRVLHLLVPAALLIAASFATPSAAQDPFAPWQACILANASESPLSRPSEAVITALYACPDEEAALAAANENPAFAAVFIDNLRFEIGRAALSGLIGRPDTEDVATDIPAYETWSACLTGYEIDPTMDGPENMLAALALCSEQEAAFTAADDLPMPIVEAIRFELVTLIWQAYSLGLPITP